MRGLACSNTSAGSANDRNGVITGSGYHVNPKVLGYASSAYIGGVKLEKGSMYKNVIPPEFDKIPEVTECHFTTGGPYTLLVKLYARDNEHLMDLLNNRIQEIPGVVATETMISLSQGVKREIPIMKGSAKSRRFLYRLSCKTI